MDRVAVILGFMLIATYAIGMIMLYYFAKEEALRESDEDSNESSKAHPDD